jgi:hypothetical protein
LSRAPFYRSPYYEGRGNSCFESGVTANAAKQGIQPDCAGSRALTVETLRELCGTPDVSGKDGAAWGHFGYLSDDGKTIREFIMIPKLFDREKLLGKAK